MIVTVTEVQHYTDRLFRIQTERPSSFRFTAGEFVMIGLDGTPKRAYSLTSGPYDEFLEFYSIKVPNGPLTSKLQHIKVGDTLEVIDKPTGTLTLANIELGGNLWLLATGTGIAPFISLLRDPMTYDHFDTIRVYWSVRKAKELESYDNFLQEQGIFYTASVTQDKNWNGNNKRITQIIPNLSPSRDKIMICGNLEFNKEVSNICKDWGFAEGSRKTAGTFVQEKAFVG